MSSRKKTRVKFYFSHLIRVPFNRWVCENILTILILSNTDNNLIHSLIIKYWLRKNNFKRTCIIKIMTARQKVWEYLYPTLLVCLYLFIKLLINFKTLITFDIFYIFMCTNTKSSRVSLTHSIPACYRWKWYYVVSICSDENFLEKCISKYVAEVSLHFL